MITIFEQIINKYRNKTVEIELKFRELWNIRNLYKIRRPDHIGTTMLGVSILPFIASIVISLMLIAKNKIDINMARLIVVSTIVFCCFVIATIVNMKQRNKLKEYNHLLKDKTKTEIIVDDFKNYFIRLQYSTQIEINSKIINHFEKETQNQKDKEELLSKLKQEYTIIPKNEKTVSADKIELESLKELNEEYNLQLNSEIKKLAMINFFTKSFKQDWMTTCMHGMMGGMMLMLYWNIPVFITAQNNPNTSNNLMLDLILAMAIPMLIGCFAPFTWNRYNKIRNKEALEIISKESLLLPNFKDYQWDAKKETEEKIIELEDKIVLTKTKIELLENESN